MSLLSAYTKAMAAKQLADDAQVSPTCRLQELKHQTRLLEAQQVNEIPQEKRESPRMEVRP